MQMGMNKVARTIGRTNYDVHSHSGRPLSSLASTSLSLQKRIILAPPFVFYINWMNVTASPVSSSPGSLTASVTFGLCVAIMFLSVCCSCCLTYRRGASEGRRDASGGSTVPLSLLPPRLLLAAQQQLQQQRHTQMAHARRHQGGTQRHVTPMVLRKAVEVLLPGGEIALAVRERNDGDVERAATAGEGDDGVPRAPQNSSPPLDAPTLSRASVDAHARAATVDNDAASTAV